MTNPPASSALGRQDPARRASAPDINLATQVARNARHFPRTAAVRYPGGDLTYTELDERAARFAGVLISHGVRAGDRVAYVGLNSPAFLVTLLGALRIGAIAVPINFRLAGPELANVLRRSGATVLVAESQHRIAVDPAASSTLVRHWFLVDDDPEAPLGEPPSDRWRMWSQELAQATPVTDVAASTFDDIALLMFTSGTTGEPKGVILTHGNLWWNQVNVDSVLDTRRHDVTLAVAPLFHIGGLNTFVLRALSRGGTVVLRRSFDPTQLLDDLVREKVNTLFAVPTMLHLLALTEGTFNADLSRLRTIVTAAAPVPPSLIRKYAENGLYLQQAWGLTETAPFATHLPAEWTVAKAGSAGIAMPHTEVRVVAVGTNELAEAGVSGEVLVRGPNVTPGYWQDSRATDAAIDPDGWFHSGDIGYLDEDGCLYLVDRLKDLIITGGENVYPAEVERVLSDMPGLKDVAVIGTPDERWGESVVAIVSVAPQVEVTLDDVRRHAQPHLAGYKIPTQLRVVSDVPRNASGKLEKQTLRRDLGVEL